MLDLEMLALFWKPFLGRHMEATDANRANH